MAASAGGADLIRVLWLPGQAHAADDQPWRHEGGPTRRGDLPSTGYSAMGVAIGERPNERTRACVITVWGCPKVGCPIVRLGREPTCCCPTYGTEAVGVSVP